MTTLPKNGTQTEARLDDLEQRLNIAIWLLAEEKINTMRMATALSAMLAQQMQPQVQQSILQQLMGVQA